MKCTRKNGNGKVYPPVSDREKYTVKWVPIESIQDSPENVDIYGKVLNDDPMENLVGSIGKRGLEEPILVSADKYVLSGHRRHYACRRLGWTHVPVRVRSNVRREGNAEYHRELIEYNPQRIKTAGSLLREALLRDNGVADTYAAIEDRREAAMEVDADFMEVDGTKGTTAISERRGEFLSAVQQVIEDLRSFMPLSIRQIHYRLLNNPPLKQTPKRSKFDREHYHPSTSWSRSRRPSRPTWTWRYTSRCVTRRRKTARSCVASVNRSPANWSSKMQKSTLIENCTKPPAGWTRIENAATNRLMRLPGVAVKVYLCLIRRADNETRSCWPSLGTIVRDTGAGRGNVVRGIATLCTAGLLAVEHRGSDTGRGGPSNRYRIATSSEIELVPFRSATSSVLVHELVPKRNPNYTHRTKPKNKTHPRVPLCGTEEDRATADFMFGRIQAMDPKAKAPNLDKWANEIRLMREQDGRTDAEIRAVFTWANQDGFWRSNILSPGKLREKFTTLDLKRKQGSNGNGKPDHDSSSPARVRSNTTIPDRHAKA